MVQHIILYLSIKNNTNFKLTITKLHFSIAQMYFKPYYRQRRALQSAVLQFCTAAATCALHSVCWEASYMLCMYLGSGCEHGHTAITLLPGTIRLLPYANHLP